MCSASDLLSLSPADIVTKLRLFLFLLCGLFGGMHIGALLGWRKDVADSHRARQALMSPGCGFRPMGGADGPWAWHLHQRQLRADGDAVAGTMVGVARVIGLPLARLRMALPEAMLSGSSRECTGRRALGALATRRSAPDVALATHIMFGNPSLAARAAERLAKTAAAMQASKAAATVGLTASSGGAAPQPGADLVRPARSPVHSNAVPDWSLDAWADGGGRAASDTESADEGSDEFDGEGSDGSVKHEGSPVRAKPTLSQGPQSSGRGSSRAQAAAWDASAHGGGDNVIGTPVEDFRRRSARGGAPAASAWDDKRAPDGGAGAVTEGVASSAAPRLRQAAALPPSGEDGLPCHHPWVRERGSQPNAVVEGFITDIKEFLSEPMDSVLPKDAVRRPTNAAKGATEILSASEGEGTTGGEGLAASEPSASDLMTGTALVFALLALRGFVPPLQLAEQMGRSARAFEGVRDAAGHSFRRLTALLTAMLGPGNMAADDRWMARARLWRLILLQAADGHWELCDDVALAVQAQAPTQPADGGGPDPDPRDGCPLAADAEALRAKMPLGLEDLCAPAGVDAGALWATLCGVASLERLEFCWLDRASEEGCEQPHTIVDAASAWAEVQAVKIWGPEGSARRVELSASVGAAAAQGHGARRLAAAQGLAGCLHAVVSLILPGGALRGLRHTRAGGGGGALTARFGEAAAAARGTVADHASSEGEEARDPLETLRLRAEEATAAWEELFLERVKAMRRVETRTLHGFLSAAQRAVGSCYLTILTKHETFSNFLSPVPLELPRWQSFMVLVTMVLSVLVTDVWFYYSKSLNCCVEIRGLLDDGSGTVCPPALFTAPCRGFTGNCADVMDQFSPVQGALPDGYVCHQACS